jgi:hypothetical protein
VFDVQDVNKIAKVQEKSIIKQGSFSTGVSLMEEEKIAIVTSESIDFIEYSNINEIKNVLSSNFKNNVFEPLGSVVSADKKLIVIVNNYNLIFLDSSNIKDVTLIKVLAVGS